MSHSNCYILGAAAAAVPILIGCSSSTPPEVQRSNVEPVSSAAAPLSTGVSLDAGAGTSNAGSASVPNPNGLSDPNVVATLRGLALQTSSLAGVAVPMTIDAVAATDHQVAEAALSGAVINDHAPVYVIKMTGGPFTARRHPRGQPAPQGKFLRVSVDAASYRITDIGYVDVEPDLSRIGQATVNLL